MKLIYTFLLLLLPAFADMGKIVNLELFDNQNPAIITDIEDELDHVIIDLSAAYGEEDNNSIKIEQEQAYNLGLKAYKRLGDWVLHLKLLQKVRGVASDPTNTTEDLTKEYSNIDLVLATNLSDTIDIGFSFAYELEDSNITTRTYQLGFRHIGESLNLGLTAGSKAKRSDVLVDNLQSFLSVGFSAGEASDTIFDLSATLRPKSSSAAQGVFLEHVQAKSYEGSLQIQANENFNRSGIRFDYKKIFARSAAEENSYSRKVRLHTGMKVEREENSYSIFYISYERIEQSILVNNEFHMGVSLRGFYE